MKASAKDRAKALYLATRDATDDAAEAAIKRFSESLEAQGLGSILPDVLAAFPAAAEEADADRRMTVETAHLIDQDTLDEITKAAGATKRTQVTAAVDPSLIAGVRVRTIDRVIDTTAKRAIEDLKRRVTAN